MQQAAGISRQPVASNSGQQVADIGGQQAAGTSRQQAIPISENVVSARKSFGSALVPQAAAGVPTVAPTAAGTSRQQEIPAAEVIVPPAPAAQAPTSVNAPAPSVIYLPGIAGNFPF